MTTKLDACKGCSQHVGATAAEYGCMGIVCGDADTPCLYEYRLRLASPTAIGPRNCRWTPGLEPVQLASSAQPNPTRRMNIAAGACKACDHRKDGWLCHWDPDAPARITLGLWATGKCPDGRFGGDEE